MLLSVIQKCAKMKNYKVFQLFRTSDRNVSVKKNLASLQYHIMAAA